MGILGFGAVHSIINISAKTVPISTIFALHESRMFGLSIGVFQWTRSDIFIVLGLSIIVEFSVRFRTQQTSTMMLRHWIADPFGEILGVKNPKPHDKSYTFGLRTISAFN